MSIDKDRTVCFSGYRPDKFPFSLKDTTCEEYSSLLRDINAAIIEAFELGYRNFLCGMGRGFDLLCAKAVLDIRKDAKYDCIKLVAVLPFRKHKFSGEWGKLHRSTRDSADSEICITENGYTPKSYRLRNDYMINNSSRIICYWSGTSGGTAYTVRLAKKCGLTIHNISGCPIDTN